MVKLNHILLKSKIAEQNWTQEALAERLEITDRQVRNLCKRDSDSKISLCYKMSKAFGTTMEALLIIREAE